MQNFQPFRVNEIKEVEEQKKYIQKYFFICDDEKYRMIKNGEYIIVTKQKIKSFYFKTIKNKSLIVWFFDDNDLITYLDKKGIPIMEDIKVIPKKKEILSLSNGLEIDLDDVTLEYH